MSTANPIVDVLAAPLSPKWTIDELAEQLLSAVAECDSAEVHEFVVDAATATDRQVRRLFRPLLACLAAKSAAETGTTPNVYQGELSFTRQGTQGTVLLLGHFANKPEAARLAVRRSLVTHAEPIGPVPG